MADVSVNGWIAEGGNTIIEGKKNNIILFDVVENLSPVNGIGDDIYKTNSAWFHCSFEINIDDPSKTSFIPTGYTLDRIQSNGWAWVKKEGTTLGWSQNDIFLYGEQICEYIQEGKLVNVKGQEFLLKGQDGNILRVIDVSEMWFDPMWVKEKPKILNVPYKSGLFFTKTYSEEKKA
jgi:hypothetical protein